MNSISLNRNELFTEYPPYVFDVSLCGCDGESCRAVTGHDVFETVTANIRAAIAARRLNDPDVCAWRKLQVDIADEYRAK